MQKALILPDQEIWYISPTFRMTKRLCWKPLKALVDDRVLKKKHETDLIIELKNGSTISLFGADNPDSLRGGGLNHAILDEFPLIKEEVWTEVMRPSLSDKLGSADLTGTPKGFNWAYDLCMAAKTKPDWEFFQYTTEQGGNVARSEIVDARSTMDSRIFAQEYLASFEALTGRVYDKFERLTNVDPDLKDTQAELLVGIDFNINPMTAIICVAAADECHVLDCLEIHTSNTDELAAEIRSRYPSRTIYAYPDPSGKARKTSAIAGETDYTILKRAGFRVFAPPQAPLVTDRVNAVQAMLCDAKGRRRLLVHPRAKLLIKTLEGQTYKEGTSIPEKTGLDHAGDGLGYVIWAKFNLLKNSGARGSGIQVY